MTSDPRIRRWRIATLAVAGLAAGIAVNAWMRERILVREQEVQRGEWQKHVQGLAAINDEKDQMIERVFDSQEQFERELKQALAENARLRQELAALKAATQPAADGGRSP